MILFDFSSLLLGISFSGCAMCVVLFTAWLNARSESFLLTWCLGAAQLVIGITLFSFYAAGMNYVWLCFCAFVFLITGMTFIWGAAWQYRQQRSPVKRIIKRAALLLAIFTTPYLFGLSGIGAFLLNMILALLLFASAYEFWHRRHEVFGPIMGIIVLYCMVAITFICCAVMIAIESPLVMTEAPDNWAERLNAVASIMGMTGIGATSLALHQSRLARKHRHEALTDPLTGLVNRRALFAIYGNHDMPLNSALIIFDLDGFKQVNDRYGHDRGDKVLMQFAQVLRENYRTTDTAARLGGEEFVLVMPNSTSLVATRVAERIRKQFGEMEIPLQHNDSFYCTVSAGFALADKEEMTLEHLIREADAALYQAKRSGRNRVLPALSA
ncbi:GGDEF domain-containing protein [Cellvibrio polysaccharolyticus]|uniref:diguanylate cyclase n=1 Tax=Cellvibrio polysaccharolyticus TaxID=2082724 RepID=A0A928V3W0_9GAMM|nr:GGDEF domain-containing protein [Cellvibrio polysaccharolyticus]MBE8716117.1 GGDEF domain-containing protein [Cellvibrio polysaccharolyticus]